MIPLLVQNTNVARFLYSAVGIFCCCFTVKLVSVKVPVSIEMFVNYLNVGSRGCDTTKQTDK